jgi:hypothetical protein
MSFYMSERIRYGQINQGQSKRYTSLYMYFHLKHPGKLACMSTCLRPHGETCPRRMGFENASFAYRSSPSSQCRSDRLSYGPQSPNPRLQSNHKANILQPRSRSFLHTSPHFPSLYTSSTEYRRSQQGDGSSRPGLFENRASSRRVGGRLGRRSPPLPHP